MLKEKRKKKKRSTLTAALMAQDIPHVHDEMPLVIVVVMRLWVGGKRRQIEEEGAD